MTRATDITSEPGLPRGTTREALATNPTAMVSKVIEDIRFLRDRIERIKKLHTPNSTVLKTYESMLASREAVLAWLRDNGELDERNKVAG